MCWLTGCMLAGLLALPAQSKQASWDVAGIFVDAQGTPQPESEIARYFLMTDGKHFPVGDVLKADAEGRFSGAIKPYKLPMTYIAMNKDRSLGALAVLTEESVKEPLRIVLKPLAEVSFTPDIEGGYEPVSMTIGMTCPGTNVVLGYQRSPYRIPEGSYELSFSSLELERNRKPFSVTSGQRLDLGSVPVRPTPFARSVGKEALPLEFAEARGVPQDFKVGDLKGKWVLLEFWGYWCGPCVGTSLPHLIEFYNRHPELRSRFEILAIHESGHLTTFKELDEKNARNEKEIWRTKLPFPVLIDKEDKTVDRYGIVGYPTTVLIDPAGRIVKGGNLELLKQKLGVIK